MLQSSANLWKSYIWRETGRKEMRHHFHSQGKFSFQLIPQFDNPDIIRFLHIHLCRKLMNGKEHYSSIVDHKASILCHPYLRLSLPQRFPHEIPQYWTRLPIQYNHHSFTLRSTHIDQKCLLLLSGSWKHYHYWGVSNPLCINFVFQWT